MAINLLFLCTGNSARSILGEAVAQFQTNGRCKGYSAGSFPTGQPNPFAILQLQKAGLETGFARSKSWDEFAQDDAPKMNAIITVCDNAANETCPIWPGHPVTAHWGLPDPAAVEGDNALIESAFAETYARLLASMNQVVQHPIEDLDQASLRGVLRNAAP